MNVLLWSTPVWESTYWKTILFGELCLLYYLYFIIKDSELIMCVFHIGITGIRSL